MDGTWAERHYKKLVDIGMVIETDGGRKFHINPHIKALLAQENKHAVVGRIVRTSGTTAVTPVFKSQREFTIYQAMVQLCPNHLVFPNCSLQSIIGFDRIKELVSEDEFSYYMKAIVDIVVVTAGQVHGLPGAGACSCSERGLLAKMSSKGGTMSDSSMIGKAKELAVAGQLVRAGIHVFMPLVDNGIDLIAASRDGKVFVPVQVKYKQNRSGFTLHSAKAEAYAEEAVLAFGSAADEHEEEPFYFFTVREWLNAARDQATGRGDEKISVYIARTDPEWLNERKGERGMQLAFARIFEANARMNKTVGGALG